MLRNNRPRFRDRYLAGVRPAYSTASDRPCTPRPPTSVPFVATVRGDTVPVSRTGPELAQCRFNTCRSIYGGPQHWLRHRHRDSLWTPPACNTPNPRSTAHSRHAIPSTSHTRQPGNRRITVHRSPALCDFSHAHAGRPLLMCATGGLTVGSPCPDAEGPPINANQRASTADHELPMPRYHRYDPERQLCGFVLAALPDDNHGDRSRRVTRCPADRIRKA